MGTTFFQENRRSSFGVTNSNMKTLARSKMGSLFLGNLILYYKNKGLVACLVSATVSFSRCAIYHNHHHKRKLNNIKPRLALVVQARSCNTKQATNSTDINTHKHTISKSIKQTLWTLKVIARLDLNVIFTIIAELNCVSERSVFGEAGAPGAPRPA